MGDTEEPNIFIERMRRLRRSGQLNYQTSISYRPALKEIHVNTDGGRLMRPLLLVRDNKVLLRVEDIRTGVEFEELRKKGLIELLDVR